MARPSIHDEPMTAAERMRRHRVRKKVRASWSADKHAYAERYMQPIRIFAPQMLRISPRQYYYTEAMKRHALIKWPDDILDGSHGRVGMEFLAEVCEHGDIGAQRAIRDAIRKKGAQAGRALWHQMLSAAGPGEAWDLINRRARRRNTCG